MLRESLEWGVIILMLFFMFWFLQLCNEYKRSNIQQRIDWALIQ